MFRKEVNQSRRTQNSLVGSYILKIKRVKRKIKKEKMGSIEVERKNR